MAEIKILNNEIVSVSTGKLGVGTTSPGNLLHIRSGASGFGGTYDVRNKSIVEANGEAYYATYVPDNSFSGIRFFNTSGLRGFIDYYHGTQGDALVYSATNHHRFLTNGVERVRLIQNGYVGIGTTSPSEKLHVSGSILANSSGIAGTVMLGSTSNSVFADSSGNLKLWQNWSSSSRAIVASAGAVTVIGDTNDNDSATAHIFTVQEGDIAGGNTRMVVTKSGNVGIGTTSPTQSKLVVAGDISIPRNNSLVFLESITGTFRAKITSQNTFPTFNGLEFYTGNDGSTPKMTISDTGNVGIGTTSPSRTLSVETTDTATYDATVNASEISVSRKNTSNTAGQVAAISLNATGWSGSTTGVVVLNAIQRQGNYSNADFAIQNRVGGSFEETFRITAYGNVGIGTDSPGSKLHVGTYGLAGNYVDSSTLPTTPANHLITLSPPSTAGYYGGGIAWSEGTNVAASINAYDAGSGGALGLVFSTGNNTTLSESFRIATDGNVGIGTTDPGAKLDLSSSSGIVFRVNPNNTAKKWYIDTTNPDKFKKESNMILSADTANTHTNTHISLEVDGSVKMRVQHDGKVGIGTTSPAYALDVSGTIRATGDVIAYSDARVKENVETIPNALDKVKSMRGVGYNKIGEQKRSVGVIAQELLEVLPEAVHQDKSGMYSVAYGNIVGVLVEAIKELEERVELLEEKIKQNGITE